MIAEETKVEGKVLPINLFTISVNGIDAPARIDTGADISMIPENLIDYSREKRQIKIMDHAGNIRDKIQTYNIFIVFDKRRFDIDVLPRKDFLCLIGMDIIRHCHLEMQGGICILE
jgi:hypothetical protein